MAAILIGAVSSIPRIRLWEYFNEFAGGPSGAYRHFGDEGVDMGQRTLDYVRYYRERLESAAEVPYLLYPMSLSEQKRRGVRARGVRGSEEEEEKSADVSGTFFVSSVAVVRNPRYQVFREADPVERIGNLFIYRGKFHLPWLRERQLLLRARRLLTTPKPDLDKAEALFQEVLVINPKSFSALSQLGNLKLRRGERGEAIRFYERARDQLGNEDQAMRAILTKQIERLSSNEPLEQIAPVRGTREE